MLQAYDLIRCGRDVMKQLDRVRKRPGMYIGDTTDGSGLHRMVYELVDNAIDEALAGHCDRVEVVLNAEGSVSVRDNGRGIPTDIHPSEGVSAAEVIMTRLHVFGKFEQLPRKMTDELHRVGVSVVNALSEVLELRIWRHGKQHFMRFRMGDPEAPLVIVGNADMLDGKPPRGTEITFLPDNKIFAKTEFVFATIEHRLHELASLNSDVIIALADNRGIERKQVVFHI
jgi:DNA gyrase subunit B